MSYSRASIRVAACWIVLIATRCAGATGLPKLDTWNRIQMEKIIEAGQIEQLRCSREKLSVILRVRSPEEDLKRLKKVGVIPRCVAGTTITAEVPAGRLEELTRMKSVLNLKVCDIRHRPLSLPVRPKGPVVGIVDVGFVWKRAAFMDEKGRSRIVAFWDQKGGGARGPILSTDPTYGIEYAGEEIERLFAATRVDIAPGHGGAVAAIAAGNDSILCETGMLPSKSGKASSSVVMVRTTKDEGDVIDAVGYIKKRCQQWGVRCVINLSYGKHNGPHDGSSFLSGALEVMASDSCLIVVSAGNDGGMPIHAHTVVQDSASVGFDIFNGTTPSPSEGVLLSAWYDAHETVEVGVYSPSGERYGPVRPHSWKEWDAAQGNIVLANGISHAPGTDQEILLVIQDDTKYSIESGRWSLYFVSPSNRALAVDLWIVSAKGYSCVFDPEQASPSALSDVCTSKEVISVGGYLEDEGSYVIAPGSAMGPTKDGRSAPDVLAPWNAPVAQDGEDVLQIDGTSFSAAFVTRTIARIWASFPDVSGQEIRDFLTHRMLVYDASVHSESRIASFRKTAWKDIEEHFSGLRAEASGQE